LALIHSQNIRKNLFFLIGGIFVNCGITLLQAWVFPGIVAALSINPGKPDLSDIGRLQGLTSHPNSLGFSGALAVLIGAGLLSFERRRYVRWGLALLVLVCTIAALLSGSRTFLVALIPGLIVFAFLQKLRRRALARALVAMLVLGGGVAYLAPGTFSQYSDRLELTGLDYNSDYARLMTTTTAVEEISQKPIFGWGVDQIEEAGLTLAPEISSEVIGAHNAFLSYWYSTGLLGAIGFLALFVIPARRMVQVLKKKPASNSANALSLGVASYVLIFIIILMHPVIYNRYLYVPMFVFAGFAARLRGPAEARLATRHFVVTNRPPGAV
jgi:O-antigen ligase